MPKVFLPELEMYVMLAIARLEPDAYGALVRQEIETRAGRPVAIGALYATLSRLEEKGLISTREVLPRKGERGRPRKYCALTQRGHSALEHSMAKLRRMAAGLTYDLVPEGRR